MEESSTSIHELVRTYYGETLQSSDDLKTDACCNSSHVPPKYVIDVLEEIEDDIVARFYGCGSPIPPALEGATVLDLGCGTGRDVYICSKLVGPKGRVIGVDMTESQLDFAKSFEDIQMKRFGFSESNVEFHQGYIEDLASMGIEDNSIDVLISNCVINLSPFKDQVFKEIFRVLKPGGELYYSDIFSDRRVPPDFYDDPVLRGECLSGALYIEDFREMLSGLGVDAFYNVEVAPLSIHDFQIATKLGCIGFYSHTVRAVKSPDFEKREENYGQSATYLGTMPENKRYFDFNEEIRFIKGRPVAISGNIATLLQNSRYAKHFEIRGTTKNHYGRFNFADAQESLLLKTGKATIGLEELEQSCEKLEIEPFHERVHDKDLLKSASRLSTMQVNLGYRCNLACTHCFLESNPLRTEQMSKETMESVLKAFETGCYETLDITGGSPEMNPHLEWFLEAAAPLAKKIIVRSNFCILEHPEYEHFIDVYTKHKVHLVTSLPYYDQSACDTQRGDKTFNSIIAVLRKFNERGYGTDPELMVDVVYNVSGPFLPPNQYELEEFYAYQLKNSQDARFNNLFAFNNYPLGRFANHLKKEGKFDYYLELLDENYNAAVVAHMMCRSQINVDYDGRLYDCEVSHVLGLPIDGPTHIDDIVDTPLDVRNIQTNPICYSCAAGSGSSCGGSLLDQIL